LHGCVGNGKRIISIGFMAFEKPFYFFRADNTNIMTKLLSIPSPVMTATAAFDSNNGWFDFSSKALLADPFG